MMALPAATYAEGTQSPAQGAPPSPSVQAQSAPAADDVDLPAPASSSPDAPARSSTATKTITRFTDWELICPQLPAPQPQNTSGNSCRVSQLLAVKRSGETVFAVSVLAAKQPGQQVVIISTPIGGYLVPGLELKIDRAKPVRLLYETCNVSDKGRPLAGRAGSLINGTTVRTMAGPMSRLRSGTMPGALGDIRPCSSRA
jgi:invasion protein IalB